MSTGDPVGLQKQQGARVVEHRDSTLVLGADGRVHRFPADSGALVAELMRLLARRRTRDELLAALGSRFEDVGTNASTIDAALEHLQQAGVIGRAAPSAPKPKALERKLVLGLTGAVSTALAPALVAQLVSAGFRVRVAMTKAARRFVTPLALEAITHEAVVTGLWHRSKELPTPHINLAEWADAMLVCPASATTLARIAAGDCSDLVSATAISTKAPVLLVPSMNAAMHEAPAVRRNLELLRDDGFHVALPGVGHEVAHAPNDRALVSGPAPSPRDVLAMLEAVLATATVSRSAQMDTWDQRYQTFAPEQLPWHADALDPDLVDVISVLPRPEHVLDVGTGLGTVARELARRGLNVTATDLSAVALARAQVACAGLSVTLVHDDAVTSRLTGPFELVVDRGVLHVLPDAQVPLYVATLARLVPRGGHLVVKVHAENEARELGTRKLSADALEQVLSPSFERVRITPSTFPGTLSPEPQALLGVFRRAS